MKRIQISRQHKDPPGTKRCVRPGKFGNDFKVGEQVPEKYLPLIGIFWNPKLNQNEWYYYNVKRYSVPSVSEAIRLHITYQLPTYTDDDLRKLLPYKNLGCWCSGICHVDELINEIKRRKLI